jgi:hypothetical protein
MIQRALDRSRMATYTSIVSVVNTSTSRPTHISEQVWRKMRRVAQDAKLSRIDPALLPTSLSALTELARLPIDRIRRLRDLGVLGPGLTARRIRVIGRSGPIVVVAEIRFDQDTPANSGVVRVLPGQ